MPPEFGKIEIKDNNFKVLKGVFSLHQMVDNASVFFKVHGYFVEHSTIPNQINIMKEKEPGGKKCLVGLATVSEEEKAFHVEVKSLLIH